MKEKTKAELAAEVERLRVDALEQIKKLTDLLTEWQANAAYAQAEATALRNKQINSAVDMNRVSIFLTIYLAVHHGIHADDFGGRFDELPEDARLCMELLNIVGVATS